MLTLALEFKMDEDEVLSDGERPRKMRRPPSKSQGIQDIVGELVQAIQTSASIHQGCPQGHEEWKEPSDEELVELYAQKEKLNALRAEGPLTLPQRVALAKNTARVKEIERMMAQQPQEPGHFLALLDDEEDEDTIAEELLNQGLRNPQRGQDTPTTPTAAGDQMGASGEDGAGVPNVKDKKPQCLPSSQRRSTRSVSMSRRIQASAMSPQS